MHIWEFIQGSSNKTQFIAETTVNKKTKKNACFVEIKPVWDQV